MKKILGLGALLSALGTSLPTYAMPYDTPETWGGDLASRQRLTGDWGGLRDDMAKKGIVFDMDVYWAPMEIMSGGKDETSALWGNAVAKLNVDTQKLGWWPGGFLKIQTVTSFNNSLINDTGAIIPANAGWSYPTNEPYTSVQEFTYTQFLSKNFGVYAGKINTIEPTNWLTGDYRTGFMNLAFVPLALAMLPLSAYGAGALYMPSHDVTLGGMVLDANGTIKNNDLGDAFKDGVFLLGTADLKVKPMGLAGHHTLILGWSNKDRTSLIQDPSNIAGLLLKERFPGLGNPGPVLLEILENKAPGLLTPTQPLNQEDDTWAAVYRFEQFLWQPSGETQRGIGAFFTAGVSDGKANPVKYSFNMGLVGKGVIPGRPNDSFGIGWARTEFSDNFVPYLRDTFDLGLDREDAVELFYSAAVTPWLNVSPNLQIIHTGLDKAINASGEFENLDTVYIAGVRVGIRF